MSYDIPLCKVVFDGRLSDYEDILEIGAYSTADLVRGICNYYPDFESTIWDLSNTANIKLVIEINGEFTISSVEDVHIFYPYRTNVIKITALDSLQGNVGKFIAGGLLIAAAFTGVGFLGISSVSLGIIGLSLVGSSIYKAPKVDKEKDPDKRSANFSGTINTTGGGQPLPIVTGEAWIGSIVASGYITPESKPVN